MIGYVTLGTNDLERAGAFYDKLLAQCGAVRAYTLERMIAWCNDPVKPMFGITGPSEGNAATPGNGVMVATLCNDAEQVRAVHSLALSLGAENAGTPDEFGGTSFGGYFRDLDDNKICAFVMSPDTSDLSSDEVETP